MEEKITREILSDLTVHMKYAKYLPKKQRRETWKEIVNRNKEMHIKKFPELKSEIEEAYKMVLNKKVLPSMRSIQFAGKPIDVNPTRIYNCSYLPIDDWRCFSEVMFLLLSGTGVGFSVQKHHVESLPEIRKPNPNRTRRYLIGDSIEGWSDAIKILIKSYFGQSTSTPIFDYSDIRPKGTMLITSGGKAPGPQPLKDCIHNLSKILDNKKDGQQLKPIEVHDLICHIADAVLAGGIRRAALISLFSITDEEMMACKFGNWYETNPQRGRANNSVVILRHKVKKEDFLRLWEKIENSGSGEPGLYFSNSKDMGVNPCCEISLRPYSYCNLTEINVSDVESQEDLNERAKVASFIGTLQASYTDFHYLRDVWQRTTEKDSLIGVGMTGIASGEVLKYDLKEAANAVKQENERVSNLIGIKPAARTTCIKPSGCVIPETEFITNKGVLSFAELFSLCGYDLNDFKDKEKVFLDVNEDVKVLDKNNDLQNITKLFVNGFEETYDIEFNDGLVVSVTGNHKFLTVNRGWVRCDELDLDDDIINF